MYNLPLILLDCFSKCAKLHLKKDNISQDINHK